MKTKWISAFEKSKNIERVMFPDGQPHVDLKNIERGDEVNVVIRLQHALDIINLLQISNALDNLGAIKSELHIPYLMGARYDRSMRKGDSVDLKVFAQLINSCHFERVILLDVHSDVALQLIENSTNVSNRFLVEEYEMENAVLICPDAGAMKKVEKYSLWNPKIEAVVYCMKKRDLNSGAVQLKVLEPEKCEGHNCVIIDDICDGGATFLAIASQIKPAHLTLIVTHGIFSKGLRKLKEYFHDIITTDSFKQNDEPRLRTIKLNY